MLRAPSVTHPPTRKRVPSPTAWGTDKARARGVLSQVGSTLAAMTRRYLPTATRRARNLRRQSTVAEGLLWSRLRRRALGVRFRRQVPIGPFIVDFACLERGLVVECDGEQHFESRYDRRRDSWLERRGFTVLRFWNHEVLGNIEMVADTIAGRIAVDSPPYPQAGPFPHCVGDDTCPPERSEGGRGPRGEAAG